MKPRWLADELRGFNDVFNRDVQLTMERVDTWRDLRMEMKNEEIMKKKTKMIFYNWREKYYLEGFCRTKSGGLCVERGSRSKNDIGLPCSTLQELINKRMVFIEEMNK